MATRKVTITVGEEQLDAVRALVDSGAASSLSGFVQHAIRIALDDVAGWRSLLAKALDETGGPLTKKERRRADAILGRRASSRHRRRAA